MPKNPDKFGIKYWLAVDVEAKNILNVIPYLSKDEIHAPSHMTSDWVVINLLEPYLGKGRNVTTNNFFTSYTSTVETVNKVIRELPPSAKPKQATRYLSVLMKSGDGATPAV